MNITTLANATSLLDILMKNGDDDRHQVFKYISLCNILIDELHLGECKVKGRTLSVVEAPQKIGDPEKWRADILLAVAGMYLKK